MLSEGECTQPYIGEGITAGFNGELFNLSELRKRLDLPAASEIELFARGFQRFGANFLRSIDGQFAGFVFEEHTQTLTLIRDRFGISPLYWAQDAKAFYFASNLSSLRSIGGGGPISSSTVTSLFAHYGLPTIGPIAARACLLHAGTTLTIDSMSRIRLRSWVAPEEVLGPKPREYDLGEHLEHAVRSRLRGDGCTLTLSGGIDSTLVAALAVEHGLETSYGLAEAADSDSITAQLRVASGLGLRHQVVSVTASEILDEFENFVLSRRTPLSRLGPIGMSLLARRVRADGYRAVLAGEGADELFFGYDAYRIELAKGGAFGSSSNLDWSLLGSPEFRLGSASAARYWKAVVGLGDMRGRRLNALARSFICEDADGLVEDGPPDDSSPHTTVSWMRTRDLRDLLGGYLLPIQGDQAFMENTVELRPPMLANGVADWALSRRPQDEIEIANGKLSLRRLLGRLKDREGVPLSAYDRPKTAYRINLDLIKDSPVSWSRFLEYARASDHPALKVKKIVDMGSKVAPQGHIPESLSMALIICASFGLLGDAI